MKARLFLFAATFSLIFSSCSKDDADSCKTDMAHIAGNYKVSTVTYQTSSSATPQNVLNDLLEACERDDILTINANGTGVSNDAGTKCSPEGTYNFDWSLNGNTITIDGEDAHINSFDCQKLLLHYTNLLAAGDILAITYTKQ